MGDKTQGEMTMRLNVKTADAGIEGKDWDHIDGVVGVDIRGDFLRFTVCRDGRQSEDNYKLENVVYFHVTMVYETLE